MARMLFDYTLETPREHLYDITAQVRDAIGRSGVDSGIAVVYCPHTTGAITINENVDPDVVHDVLLGLGEALPDRRTFRHREGNSDAHLKSSTVGTSETVIVAGGRPLLGTWQGIYFCEFDPPRSRKFFVKVIAG